jgi:hypothetical protein
MAMTIRTILSISRLNSAPSKVHPVGKFELVKMMEIANLLLILDLEGFVKTFKEEHGADHVAPLVSFPENSGVVDSSLPAEIFPTRPAPVLSFRPNAELLATRPDAASPTSVSSSAPPVLPDFPWHSQPSLTMELIDGHLSLEKVAGGVITPPCLSNNTATSQKSSHSGG